MREEIKFVSYDGRYPNLCSGTLVLHKGDNEYSIKRGLMSGGRCWFDNDWEAYTEQGDWELDISSFPDELKPYAKEITRLVNENIPRGCCGGCL